MPLIAALLPNPTDRASLRAASSPHELSWSESWRELHRAVRRDPVAAVVADIHAESRRDGALRIYRFAQRYPLTPLVVWGDLDGRELFRAGKAGAAEVVVARESDDAELVRAVLAGALRSGIPAMLDERLRARLAPDACEVAMHAALNTPRRLQVPALAAAFGLSVSTLERRCEGWGMPTPGRLLLWLRVLYGLRWLLEPGRSVESVAQQLAYSSGAAFRRAIKATVGGRPSPLRTPDGLQRAVDAFIAECPGTPAGPVS
jgi:AraC-like DNA-binding protein